MPSQTFYRLSEEKQKKLIRSALEEFSNTSFNDASINTIIAKAGISRGSFYMYFEDKEDLFRYLLETHKNAFQTITKQAFQNHQGELFFSFLEIFDHVMEYVEQSENKAFIRNTLMNMTAKQEGFLIPHGIHPPRTHTNEILELIDHTNLNYQTEEDLQLIIKMCMDITVHTMMSFIHNAMTKEQAKEIYTKKIQMLRYGIERRDVC